MATRAIVAALILATSLEGGHAFSLDPYRVVADAIPEPLGGRVGDPRRGARILRDREVGNCLICHSLDDPSERFQGELGPALDGIGARLSEGQIRLRIVDSLRLNEATLMPSYYRVEGLRRVAPQYRGKPILDAQQVEDLVAYLASLRG